MDGWLGGRRMPQVGGGRDPRAEILQVLTGGREVCGAFWLNFCSGGATTEPTRADPPPREKTSIQLEKPHPPLGFLDLVIRGYPHSFAPAVYGAAAPRRVSLRSVHPDRSFKRWPSAPASPVPRRGAGCTHNPPGLFDYHLPVARRWRSAKLPNPAFARRCRAPWGYSHQSMPRPIPAN